jgi:hypothetical protein
MPIIRIVPVWALALTAMALDIASEVRARWPHLADEAAAVISEHWAQVRAAVPRQHMDDERFRRAFLASIHVRSNRQESSVEDLSRDLKGSLDLDISAYKSFPPDDGPVRELETRMQHMYRARGSILEWYVESASVVVATKKGQMFEASGVLKSAQFIADPRERDSGWYPDDFGPRVQTHAAHMLLRAFARARVVEMIAADRQLCHFKAHSPEGFQHLHQAQVASGDELAHRTEAVKALLSGVPLVLDWHIDGLWKLRREIYHYMTGETPKDAPLLAWIARARALVDDPEALVIDSSKLREFEFYEPPRDR